MFQETLRLFPNELVSRCGEFVADAGRCVQERRAEVVKRSLSILVREDERLKEVDSTPCSGRGAILLRLSGDVFQVAQNALSYDDARILGDLTSSALTRNRPGLLTRSDPPVESVFDGFATNRNADVPLGYLSSGPS